MSAQPIIRYWKFDYEKDGKQLVIVIEGATKQRAERNFPARTGAFEASKIVEVELIGERFMEINDEFPEEL